MVRALYGWGLAPVVWRLRRHWRMEGAACGFHRPALTTSAFLPPTSVAVGLMLNRILYRYFVDLLATSNLAISSHPSLFTPPFAKQP